MDDGVEAAIEGLTHEVRDLADRIDGLERSLLSASPAGDSSISGQLERLTSEVRAIRREMF